MGTVANFALVLTDGRTWADVFLFVASTNAEDNKPESAGGEEEREDDGGVGEDGEDPDDGGHGRRTWATKKLSCW